MEYDRYQQNSKLFIVGMITLLVSLSLLAFALYILPYLIWTLPYKVPAFVLDWREYIKRTYEISEARASWWVFFTFIIPSVVCGYISYLASNRIDNQIYHVIPEKPEEEKEIVKKDFKESTGLSLKILGSIILTIAVVTLLEWLIVV